MNSKILMRKFATVLSICGLLLASQAQANFPPTYTIEFYSMEQVDNFCAIEEVTCKSVSFIGWGYSVQYTDSSGGSGPRRGDGDGEPNGGVN